MGDDIAVSSEIPRFTGRRMAGGHPARFGVYKSYHLWWPRGRNVGTDGPLVKVVIEIEFEKI